MSRSVRVFDRLASEQLLPFPALRRREVRLRNLRSVEELLALPAPRPGGMSRDKLLATRGSLMLGIAADEEEFRTEGPGRN